MKLDVTHYASNESQRTYENHVNTFGKCNTTYEHQLHIDGYQGKTVCIPEEVYTKYCVLLFFRRIRICMQLSVRMEPGKVTGYLSKTQDNSGEFPHVWS